MNKLMMTGSLGLAGLVATGLIAWQAPMAFADHGADDRGGDNSRHHHGKALKRDDDGHAVVTTVDDDDDDDTGLGHQTRTRTRGAHHEHSRGASVRDLT